MSLPSPVNLFEYGKELQCNLTVQLFPHHFIQKLFPTSCRWQVIDEEFNECYCPVRLRWGRLEFSGNFKTILGENSNLLRNFFSRNWIKHSLRFESVGPLFNCVIKNDYFFRELHAHPRSTVCRFNFCFIAFFTKLFIKYPDADLCSTPGSHFCVCLHVCSAYLSPSNSAP